MAKHDYFNYGSLVRSVVFSPDEFKEPVRYVPWCLGVYRAHCRYVPYCLGVWRYQSWHTIRNTCPGPEQRRDTKLRFLWNNLWDQGNLTASSQQNEFPAINTQHHWLSRCWHSGEGEIKAQWLKCDFEEPKDVRAFVLVNHWFNCGTEVRLQANNVDAWGAPPVDVHQVVLDGDTLLVHFFRTYQKYRYWRIRMHAIGASGLTGEEDISTRGDKDNVHYCNPYFRVGRIFLGDYTELSRNYTSRYTGDREDSYIYKTLEKQTITRPAWPHEVRGYHWDNMNEDDLNLLLEIYENRGIGQPFFIVENYRYWWKRTYYVAFKDEFKAGIPVQNRASLTIDFKETH